MPDEALPRGRAAMAETSAPGVRLWTAEFEEAAAMVRKGLRTLVAEQSPTEVHTPSVIAREVVERAGYARLFPHLLGTVSYLPQGAPATDDLVLAPVVCHHAYPLLAGDSLPAPRSLVLHGACFRAEHETGPGRLRSFRMSEVLRIADSADTARWHGDMVRRLARWFDDLGLDVVVAAANDPFFGRGRTMLRESQIEQGLKWELKCAVAEDTVQAVASCNLHHDKFGAAFAIEVAGRPAHTACLGVGIERLVLALALRHGPRPASWSRRTRAALTAASV